MAKARILIVEDEPIPANDIRVKLEKMGYAVIDTVSTGEEAVEKAEEADLAIMDIRLRGNMDGTDAAREIKERFDIPVVFLTALGDRRTLEKAKKAEPYGYLGKPFRESDLHTTIEVSLYRHEVEKRLMQEEEKYRRLFINLNEGMALHEMIYDEDGEPVNYVLTDVNPRYEELTGLSRGEGVGKTATDVYGGEKAPYLDSYSKVVETGESMVFETYYEPTDKYFHISVFSDTRGNFVTLFSDITERKLAEKEEKSRLMRFDLKEGNLYLAKEKGRVQSTEAFTDLLRAGYHGLALSGSSQKELKKQLELDFDYRWLAESNVKHSLSPDPKKIKQVIEKEPCGSAIMIHDLDCLISRVGFKQVLFLIQSLRETMHFKNGIVILSVDPNTLSPIQLRYLERETWEILPKGRKRLPAAAVDILKFVQRQNLKGVKPNHELIRKEFDISRPTLKKRLGLLVKRGYVRVLKRGRGKSYYRQQGLKM